MKIRYFHIIAALIIGCITPQNCWAQDEPFNCDFNAYLFQFNDVYAIDLASGSAYLVAQDIVEERINGTGYNPADGFIWGALSNNHEIIRIGKDFNYTTFTIPELPTSNPYIGDISYDGIYYLKAGGPKYHSIDLNPGSVNYGSYISEHTLSENLNIHDWAFNAVDNLAYTVEKNTNRLLQINPVTGQVTSLGVVPILSNLKYTFGAVYFDVDGNFYVSANQTGTVYIIYNVQSITNQSINSNVFAFGPSSSSNDGARCPTAPVPQEDCINGIDDDGDGLIDCDDPSCSGVASCPVIEVSGGNDGGLESNNRLANLINRRNFKRSKENNVFDRASAKKFKKEYKSNKAKYATSHTDIPLNELIPENAISNATLFESSPKDLLGITNATEVLSVDYYLNDFRAGALLALKTENAVYEHSKFICDRLLGAEILSVSTMDINEHSFLKSLIKRPDGSLEFVLSFSAGIEDEGLFIESHWNIDEYQDNRGFYNFQIWAGSIDDLYNISSEIINLLESKAPIVGYHSSVPPPVFVKSATYKNGDLQLQIVNSTDTKAVSIDGGLKRTETSLEEKIQFEAELNQYITPVTLKVGGMFDLGFRVSNELDLTPDDLFISDGPWGLDDAAGSTVVLDYQISPNAELYQGEGYRLERDAHVSSTTKEYVSLYKAFNPRFSAVDLSQYNNFGFEASGTGLLEITLIKSMTLHWEDQPKVTVQLTDSMSKYSLADSEFKSVLGERIDFSDLKMVVFTQKSSDGQTQTKSLNITNLEFKHNIQEAFSNSTSYVVPNPMKDQATVFFPASDTGNYEIILYDQRGTCMRSYQGFTIEGINGVSIDAANLDKGIYYYRVVAGASGFTGKVILTD